MKNLTSILLCLLLVGTINLTSAQTQKNPICYVCFDGGVSTITRPNTTVPLPSFLNLGKSISCKQIQIAGEILYLVPEQACQLLNFPAFRVACGCENAWSPAPRAVPVSAKAPTIAKGGNDMNTSKKTSVPSPSPSATPSGAPTPAPVKKGLKNNMDGMKTIGGDIDPEEILASDYPSLSPRVSPSDYPSLSPSASPNAEMTPDQIVDFAEEVLETFRESFDDNDVWTMVLQIVITTFRESLINLYGEDIFSDDNSSDTPSTIVSSVPSTVQSDVPSTIVSEVPSTIISDIPSDVKSFQPSSLLSDVPSDAPTDFISILPSSVDSKGLIGETSTVPSSIPSNVDSDLQSAVPSSVPSDVPSVEPSSVPSDAPSDVPSVEPSTVPSDVPSTAPSSVPSEVPSTAPSSIPSEVPSTAPSSVPSLAPSDVPSDGPSSAPSDAPSSVPTIVLLNASPEQPTTVTPDSPREAPTGDGESGDGEVRNEDDRLSWLERLRLLFTRVVNVVRVFN